MPRFRATVEKFHGGYAHFWTNIYWVEAGDLAAALPVANSIATAELPLYSASVTVTKVRVDDAVENTDAFLTTVRNAIGTRAASAADSLPLFVVARVDFSAAGGGRPSRKYIRGCLDEADVQPLNLVAGVKTILQTYGDAIVGLAVVDPDGADLTSAAVWPRAAMRQMRRGSKKRSPRNRMGN